jgi:hypothetical protein
MMSKAVLLVALLLSLSACAPGKYSFRVAQVCVIGEQGVLQLVHEMKEIANEEKMEFVDASKDTARGLDIIDFADGGRADGSAAIHVVVQRADGMGVTVTNISLPGYQMALGFSEGSNRSDAVRFADKVQNRLAQHWRVEVLPPGSGVMPDPKCK